MALRVRPLTPAERQQIRSLCEHKAVPRRMILRMCIVLLSAKGMPVPVIAHEVGVSEHTVRLWIKRFIDYGLDGLEDLPRPGAAPKYAASVIDEIVAIARTYPRRLGLAFESWTLDSLRDYLRDSRGVGMGRSRLCEVLVERGVRWQGPYAVEPRRFAAPEAMPARRPAVLCASRRPRRAPLPPAVAG